MTRDRILVFPVLYRENNLKISVLSIFAIRWNSWDKETLREIILQVHAVMNSQGYCDTFVSGIRLLYGMGNHIYLCWHMLINERWWDWISEEYYAFQAFGMYARLRGLFNRACRVVSGWASWWIIEHLVTSSDPDRKLYLTFWYWILLIRVFF